MRVPAPPVACDFERGLERVQLQVQARPLKAGGRGRAAPGPAPRVGRESGRDRVPSDVARSPEQVVLALELAGEKVRPEEVRAPVVELVVQARVPGVELLQRLRDATVDVRNSRW